MSASDPVHSGLRDAAVIAVLATAVFVPSLFTRDPWNPDEPRYTEIARAMVVTGDYWVPHLNGEIYPDKPALFFWLTAGLMRLGLGLYTGVNLFKATGAIASADNFIIPMGVNLRYELGSQSHPCVQFGISGGPALFLMNSTTKGMLSGLTFYGRGTLGVRLPLGSTFGITIEAGYDVYWEQPSPIMGFSPSILTTIRL